MDAHVIQPHEYDELPEITDEMLARASVNRGGRRWNVANITSRFPLTTAAYQLEDLANDEVNHGMIRQASYKLIK